jgi:hypothetical protein
MRPLAVTLSAWFEFVRAALISLVGLGVMFVGGVASRLAAVAAEGNTLQRLLAGFGEFVGVALLIHAAIQLALGLGVLILLPRLIHLRPISQLFGLLQLAVLIYLAPPETHCYFEQKESRAPIPA